MLLLSACGSAIGVVLLALSVATVVDRQHHLIPTRCAGLACLFCIFWRPVAAYNALAALRRAYLPANKTGDVGVVLGFALLR